MLFLFLLLLLMPHSREEGLPPHQRFEYKFSFKGPQLASPGAGIPFWSHHGGEGLSQKTRGVLECWAGEWIFQH